VESVRQAARALRETVASAVAHLAEQTSKDGHVSVSRLDDHQPSAYQLAFLASEATSLDLVVAAGESGHLPAATMYRGAAEILRSARSRLDGHASRLGVSPEALDTNAVRDAISRGMEAAVAEDVLAEAKSLDTVGLPDEFSILAQEFRRFGSQVIEPHAENIHREDLDIPDEVIEGLASMGAFGLSIPEQYGGMQDDDNADHLSMVVATEELSRVSLGAAGSLITRPEILARALTSGGTEEQKLRWLPEIASGSKLVAVATTEPNTGSDVAAVRTAAVRDGDVYRIRGTKTWATFAGRADLLMVLARTDPDPSSRHRGLSLFVIEKPRFSGHMFEMTQEGGGRLVGRAIPTLGYRGMHSFELAFDDWEVPALSLIGGNEAAGRGFQLQMEAFAAGRLQTAARAVGVMRAGYEAAREYAAERQLFGRRLIEFPLTVDRLASMASRIAAMRLFNYHVAEHLTTPVGQLQASMVKALSSRAAEEITRDSMQIFGGYGYAEEYPVSRYFVDARVLSIFEGSEEVLALRVIARRILEQALN